MKIKKNLRKIASIVLLMVFLWVAFFSIQNFWMGYHKLDLSFNFLNQGFKFDVDTTGKTHTLTEGYITGLKGMTDAFIWMCLDCILAVVIGFIYKKNEKRGI